jgi:hypothetical protein
VLDRAVAHTLTFVTVAPGCHIRLHSHTKPQLVRNMRTSVGGVQPAVRFGNWPRQIRLASDLTESGTKLRSRVLHLKVAVVELPYRPRSPG